MSHSRKKKKKKISHSNNLIDRGSRYRGGTSLYYIYLNTWIWKYKTMVAASSLCNSSGLNFFESSLALGSKNREQLEVQEF